MGKNKVVAELKTCIGELEEALTDFDVGDQHM